MRITILTNAGDFELEIDILSYGGLTPSVERYNSRTGDFIGGEPEYEDEVEWEIESVESLNYETPVPFNQWFIMNHEEREELYETLYKLQSLQSRKTSSLEDDKLIETEIYRLL